MIKGNHIGNQKWTEALQWTGKEGYNAESLADWMVDGEVAGSFKTFGPLTVDSTLPRPF